MSAGFSHPLPFLLPFRSSQKQTLTLGILRQRDEILESSCYLAFQELFTQVRFRPKRPTYADAIACPVLYGADHTARCSKAARHIDFRLFQERPNHLGELDEVGLSRLRGFFFVLKRPSLERPSRQVHEIHAGLFHLETEALAVVGSLTAGLEFDRVELDADDERGIIHAPLDLIDDFEHDPAAVLEAVLAVLVGPKVGRHRQELSEEIPVSAMHLNPVEPGFVTQVRRLSPHLDHVFDLGKGQGARLVESVARPGDFQLDVARADGVRIERRASLTSRMGQLRDEQRPVLLGDVRHLSERRRAVVMVVLEDGIAVRLHRVVPQHQIARDDDPDLSFAPSFVQPGVLLRREAPTADVFAFFVPVAEPFRHGRLVKAH